MDMSSELEAAVFGPVHDAWRRATWRGTVAAPGEPAQCLVSLARMQAQF
jgi:hypothetical protein